MESPPAAPAAAGAATSEGRPPARRRSFRVAFWSLVALALVARVALVLATPGYTLIHDDRDYDRLARSVAHGGAYPHDRVPLGHGRVKYIPATYRPPAWPYALGGIYAIFGPDVTAARLVLAVLGAGLVALLGLVARQLFGRRTSLIVLALGAVYMPLLLVGSSLISETLFVTFELAALAAALAYRRRAGGWRWVVLAGLFAGLASLTRFNGFLMVPVLGLLVWTGRPRFALRSLARPLAVLVAAVVAISPWTIRNALEVHAFVPVSTESGETLAGTYNDASRHDRVDPASWRLLSDTEYKRTVLRRPLPPVEKDKQMRAAALRYIGRHPTYPAVVAWWNARRLLNLEGQRRWRFEAQTIDVPTPGLADAGVYVFWVVGALALMAVVVPRSRRLLRRAPAAVWLVPGVLVLSALLVIGETPRFRAPIEPFVLLTAAAGLAALTRRQEPSKDAPV